MTVYSSSSYSTTTCNQKCTSLYSKSVNITCMQVFRSIMRMINNGSKSSLKVKLLQSRFQTTFFAPAGKKVVWARD